MRTITKEFKVYTFKEATPQLRDKIRENFDSDGCLYEHSLIERIDTLKSIAILLHAKLDYSLSCVPDRGEFIHFTHEYDDLNFKALREVLIENKDCPLTGVCYDHDFLDHLNKDNLNGDTLKMAGEYFIDSIHNEYKSMLSDEYLADHCEANNYEFTDNGEIY